MSVNNFKKNIIYSESSIMYIMRAVAIMSVLSAHSSHITSTSVWAQTNSRLLLLFGLVGVPIFFINSGYFFYSRNICSYWDFIIKKLTKIFIPWIFLTSIVYIYIIIRKQGGNLTGYLEFIFGFGNYTYFLTVLMIFYLTFLQIQFSNFQILTGACISIISLYLTSNGYLSFIDPYINPLNWLIYFIIGILLKKNNLLFKIITFLRPIRYYLLAALILYITIIVQNTYYSFYWNPFAYLFIPFFILVNLSFIQNIYNISYYFIIIGKITLPIYLIHSLFIGGIVFLTNKFELEILIPFRPVVVLLISLICIQFFSWLMKDSKYEKIGSQLLGINNR
jgi:fucose 4-O-acetylase-like acetyltransferase